MFVLPDTVISIGFLIDEGVPNRFIWNVSSQHSRARCLLVIAWLMLGYLMTMSYKSVLLTSLVSIQYERPIETLEDLLVTDRKIIMLANTSTEIMIRTDPRPGMQQLAKKVTWVPFDQAFSKAYNTIESRIQQNGDIQIEDGFLMHLFGRNLYRGRERLIGTAGYSFIIPKASLLKASSCLIISLNIKSIDGKIYFAEGPVHGHRMVSSHRHLSKDDGGCGLHN